MEETILPIFLADKELNIGHEETASAETSDLRSKSSKSSKTSNKKKTKKEKGENNSEKKQGKSSKGKKSSGKPKRKSGSTNVSGELDSSVPGKSSQKPDAVETCRGLPKVSVDNLENSKQCDVDAQQDSDTVVSHNHEKDATTSKGHCFTLVVDKTPVSVINRLPWETSFKLQMSITDQ